MSIPEILNLPFLESREKILANPRLRDELLPEFGEKLVLLENVAQSMREMEKQIRIAEANAFPTSVPR